MQESAKGRANIEYLDASYGFGGGRTSLGNRGRGGRGLYSDHLF